MIRRDRGRTEETSRGGAAGLGALAILCLVSCASPAEAPGHRADGSSGASAKESLATLPGSDLPADQVLREKYEKILPQHDDWDTEVVNQAAMPQLKAIGALLHHPDRISADTLAELAAEDVVSSPLRPDRLDLVAKDGDVAVRRARSAVPAGAHRGRQGLAEALRELAAPLSAKSDVHAEFKIVRITKDGERADTLVYYHASARAASGSVQQNAIWRCRWLLGDQSAAPLLASIELESYEELDSTRSALFSDCTRAVLARNASWEAQLHPSLDHWRARLDRSFGVRVYGHNGIAVGDANGDGLDDLFVCQGAGLPDRLFVQNLDGSATDVSVEAGVDALGETKSALFLDLDNDGDQDLIIATSEHLVAMSNDGKGRFQARFSMEAPSVYSLAAADYDADGKVDVYAACYKQPEDGQPPLPYYDATNGQPNHLYRNEGNFVFRDVTAATGMDENNNRFSFAASWEDYDNDGDPDLYVANDFGRDNLYRNNGGKFTDVAGAAGVDDIGAGMGVSWADFDRDGLMDLYVSDMFSSAGGRVAYQPRFQPGATPESQAAFRRHARGNSLFRNNGDGSFTDVSETAGVTMGRWAWGALFLDINNDGFEDIYVPNGFITNPSTDDL